MLSTSSRLLRLLSLLQTRRHWPARELSSRLEIDERTVRRDIGRLRELGYPVHASAGLGGGYSMRPGTEMPPVLLEDDEAVAVALALRAAAGSVGQMDEAALGVLAKIDQVMPARLRKRASSLHSITISMPGKREVPAVNVLMQIAGACRDNKKVKMQYQDRGGTPSTRHVEPLKLAHTGSTWYLVAWDLGRDDWRTFRVDRIVKITASGAQFVPRKLPQDTVSFVSQAIAYAPFAYRVRLKIAGSPQELAKRIPSWTGVLEQLDETSAVLSIGAPTIEALTALILFTGGEFEVLEPVELVPKLREVAERLLRSLTAGVRTNA